MWTPQIEIHIWILLNLKKKTKIRTFDLRFLVLKPKNLQFGLLEIFRFLKTLKLRSLKTHFDSPGWATYKMTSLMPGWWCWRKMEGGLLLTNSVPFSCCDVLAPRPCIEVDVLDPSRHFAYNPDKDLTIYRAGCVDQLASSVQRTVLQHLDNTLLALFIMMVGRRCVPHSAIVLSLKRRLQLRFDVDTTAIRPRYDHSTTCTLWSVYGLLHCGLTATRGLRRRKNLPLPRRRKSKANHSCNRRLTLTQFVVSRTQLEPGQRVSRTSLSESRTSHHISVCQTLITFVGNSDHVTFGLG